MSTSDPSRGVLPKASANEPPVLASIVCENCNAVCDAGRVQCWMCGASLEGSQQQNPFAAVASPVQDVIYYPAASTQPTRSPYESIFLVLLIMAALVAVVIGIGFSQDPGALIGYLILVGPAFLVSGVRGLWQYSKRGEASPKSMFLSLVISFAFTIAALAILFLAGMILLFALCFYEISKM